MSLAQGVLGSVQYQLGVPEELVSFHVLGSAAVIVAVSALWCATRDRGPAASHRPAADHAGARGTTADGTASPVAGTTAS